MVCSFFSNLCFHLFSLFSHPDFSFFLCTLSHRFLFSRSSLPYPCSAEPSINSKSSKATVCSVHPGDIVKLNCPLPEAAAIVWTKDGTSLIPDNRTLIEREQLHIRHAAPTDSGLYACQATGAKATDAVCFIVNVTGETARPKKKSNLLPPPSLIGKILLKNGAMFIRVCLPFGGSKPPFSVTSKSLNLHKRAFFLKAGCSHVVVFRV